MPLPSGTRLGPYEIVTPIGAGGMGVGVSWQYDVAPDGRFLINVTTGNAVTAPITVIQHWTPKD